MDLLDADSHSFVVKIWLEEKIEENGKVLWRGHVTHVPSGNRRYLKSLTDLLRFVRGYLREMGVQPGIGWHVWEWVQQARMSLTGRY